MHTRTLMLTAAAAMGLAAFATPLPSHAQTFKPLEAMVINPASRPVPVTGTVRLDGGAGGIAGTLRSGDRTVTAYDEVLEVTSPTTGNHGTGPIDVAEFKEVRLSLSRGSCSPCSQVEVFVYGITPGGRSMQIDQFVANQSGTDSFPWASRTYSVPGPRLSVGLRAVTGGTSNSMAVTVVGRAN